MTDPKQKAAEEYSINKGGDRSRGYAKIDFIAGWDAREKSLLEAGPEFDRSEAVEKVKSMDGDILPNHLYPELSGFNDVAFVEGARYQHQLSQPREAALRAEAAKWKDEADLWREQSAKWKAEVDKFTNSFAEISTLASCMISSRQLGEGRSALEELNEIIKREIDKLGLPGYRGR